MGKGTHACKGNPLLDDDDEDDDDDQYDDHDDEVGGEWNICMHNITIFVAIALLHDLQSGLSLVNCPRR